MSIFDFIDVEQSKSDNRTLILPHQQSAVDAMTAYYRLGTDIPDRNGVVVMPTGSGKTFTAVHWLLTEGVANGYRIVWLVHRKELVEQTYNEFVRQAPALHGTGIKKFRVLPVSGDSAHIGMSVASKADVYVCSIASVANKYGYRFIERMLGAQGKRRLIVVIDEAHHAVAANYQKVLKRITALNPNRVLLGLTATPKRMQAYDQQRLQKLFHIDENLRRKIGRHGFVYEVALNDLIASQFLAVPIRVPVETNLIGEIEYNFTPEDEAFFAKHHEFSEKMKNKIGRSSARNKIILKEYLTHQKEFGKTLIFAVDQDHAETLCKEFVEAGVCCDYAVSGRSDAQAVIARFKNNELTVLINVMMMTEGSDVPDIQTVFLTRETNSESLLLQMIGRGLRGPKAHGTKTANIVYFRDQWENFSTLNPGDLDIFEETVEDELSVEAEVLPEIATDEGSLAHMEDEIFQALAGNGDAPDFADRIAEGEELITERDVYLKLYQIMKANFQSEVKQPSTAIGWYSVIDENGEDVKLLVFDTQTDAYKKIENNLSLLLHKATPQMLLHVYFAGCEVKPDENELQYLIDYIDDTRHMPDFFTLSNANALDIKAIKEKADSLFEKEEDKEAWLKKLFDNSPIIRQIYRIFFAFKKTVLDYTEIYTQAVIQTTEPEKEAFSYVENYHDLHALLQEVLDQYPKLTADNLILIDWSRDVVRKWFALCTINPTDGRLFFQIHVNKLVCSPNVDREVIKYLIFHELLHSNGYWDHDLRSFRGREWQYPNSEQLDSFLSALCIQYNLDTILAESVADEEYPTLSLEEIRKRTQEAEAGIITDAKNDESGFNKTAEGVEEGFKYCRNCGNKLPADARFCDKCGKQTNY